MSEKKVNNLDVSFFIILGFVLIVSIVGAVAWVGSVLPSNTSEPLFQTAGIDVRKRIRLTPTPTIDPNLAERNLETVSAAITAGGCVACHSIPGIEGAVGQVGPDLTNIGVEAATRIDGYTAEEYLLESLLDPGAFIAPECPTGPCAAGVMVVPELENAQIEAIVGYLATLGVD